MTKGKRRVRLITAYADPGMPFSGTTWGEYLAAEEKRMRGKRDNVRIVVRERDKFKALAR